MKDIKFIECKECSSNPGSPILCNSCISNRDSIEKLKCMLKAYSIKQTIVKASKMKPGMVINTSPNDKDRYGLCLVVACNGVHRIEYTHFNYNDAYGGAMVGTLDANAEISIVKGQLEKEVFKSIKNDVFRNLRDIENTIDTIRLIEAMSEK